MVIVLGETVVWERNLHIVRVFNIALERNDFKRNETVNTELTLEIYS